MEAAKRINSLKNHFNEMLDQLKTNGKHEMSLIDFSEERPDLLPPFETVVQMQLACKQIGAHQEQDSEGMEELRNAFASFYLKQFSVQVKPKEVLPFMGSKEGILHVSLTFLNPGNQVLVPNPGNTNYAAVATLLGAKPISYNLNETKHWQPDFNEIEKQDLSNVKLMWLNYPHMPSGALPNTNLYADAVHFAQKHDILLVNDNSYNCILNKQSNSILEVIGAKEVAIELNSLSKSFNMSGWRVGAAFGSENHIKQLLKTKKILGSGIFLPIQQGAIRALSSNEKWFQKQRLIYANRREKAMEFLKALHCVVTEKSATVLSLWAKIPSTYKSSEEFSEKLVQEKGIFVVPGTVYGSNGKGYVRLSLCIAESQIEEAINRVLINKYL